MKITKKQLDTLIREQLEPKSEVPIEISNMATVATDLGYYVQEIVKGLDECDGTVDQSVYNALDKMQSIIDHLARRYSTLDKKARQTPDPVAARYNARTTAFKAQHPPPARAGWQKVKQLNMKITLKQLRSIIESSVSKKSKDDDTLEPEVRPKTYQEIIKDMEDAKTKGVPWVPLIDPDEY